MNLAENYIGFNCSVVFAENYLEAASASEPVAPVSQHEFAIRLFPFVFRYAIRVVLLFVLTRRMNVCCNTMAA